MKGRLAVAGLLGALALELGYAAGSDGFTVDEVTYIGAGYRYLTARDFRLNPDHPPLAKLIGALGLLGRDLRAPTTPPGVAQWGWPYAFVHVANDAGALLIWSRLVPEALTLFLAWLVWAWSRATHGTAAGLVALILVVFHPSLLAHGHLVTTDLPHALTMLAASWAFWRWSTAPTALRAGLVGLTVGLAVATRLTGWLLLPALGLLAARWRGTPRPLRRAVAARLLTLALVGLVLVPFVIWALYTFRYAPWPGHSVLGPTEGFGGRVVAAFASWRLLPEAYLEGVRFQLEHAAGGHPAYLLGRVSATGWPHYYLVACLVKNTPGFLLAVAAAAVVLWRRRAFRAGSVEAHWLVPVVVVFTAASAGRVQIGERYVLAVYPYLILLTASAVPALLEGARGRALLAALLVLHAVPSLLAAPRGYLAYFNVPPCRADGSQCLLADSNLDWGQDLPRLAAWMRGNGVRRIQLAYHGEDDPDRYGIAHEDLPGLHSHKARPAGRPFEGTTAVSPNLLFGIARPRGGGDPYAPLRGRTPDARAGVFFIYSLPEAPR